MTTLLGFLLFSFTINAALIVPFIDLLYRLRFQRPGRKASDFMGRVNSVFNKLHQEKAGTPVGGGLLIIVTTTTLFVIVISLLRLIGADLTSAYPFRPEINTIIAAFVLYGLLGLYDDVVKFFPDPKRGDVGISWRVKLVGQLALGTCLGWYMYQNLGLSIINVPSFGVVDLGTLFIPFAALVITIFSNAVNITDGLDGLSGGLLLITLFALILLGASIIDTPTTLFLALWIGGILAFLYFNTWPARIFLGDVGALSFGATLAVIGLMYGKIIAVMIISGVFLLEFMTSAVQMFGKRFLGRRLLPLSPFHLYLQSIGWEEPKVVIRAWLAGIALAIFGLWLAFL